METGLCCRKDLLNPCGCKLGHLMLASQQILKSGSTEHGFNHIVQGRPKTAHRTVTVMNTYRTETGVPAAKAGSEQSATQSFKYRVERNRAGGPSKGVSASLASNTHDKSAYPQYSHKLGNIWYREAFSTAYLGYTETGPLAPTRHVEKTTESVLLLGAQFHCRIVSETIAKMKVFPETVTFF